MRGIFLVAVFLAAASPVGRTATTVAQPSPTLAQQVDATREVILQGKAHLDAGNMAAAAAAFDSAISSKGFAKLPDDLRFPTLLVAGLIANDQGRHAHAHPLLVRATAFPAAESDAWHARLSSAYSLEDYPDSAVAVTTIAKRWPDTLVEINDLAIYKVERELADAGTDPDTRLALLRALFRAEWTDTQGESSALWFKLAQLLLAEDAVDEATGVAGRIDAARVALAMRVDKRFDRVTRADPEAFDVERLAARQVARARQRMAAAPNLLMPRMMLQGVLLDTLQPEEVVALADEAIAKTKGGAESAAYDDFAEYYAWVQDQRARALLRLARWDDAVQQWSVAARRPESGGMNVSQILNLGMLLAELERPQEALNTVAELGAMSPYGRMQLEMVRLQAALQLGKEADVAEHLAFMRAHRADAIVTWQAALLLSGDLDGAAALLVERLEHEDWRDEALSDLQQYAEVRLTPVDAKRLSRWREIIARPEVIAALERVGRIERFEIAPPRL